MENNLTGNSMVFGTTSLMYEQVLPGGPKRKDISEEELAANLDPQASSSDQVTTQILMQTKDDHIAVDLSFFSRHTCDKRHEQVRQHHLPNAGIR